MAITLTAAAPEAQYFFEIFFSLSPARYLPFLSVTPCSTGSNIDPDISTRSFILQFQISGRRLLQHFLPFTFFIKPFRTNKPGA